MSLPSSLRRGGASLSALGREALALARQATLLRHDLSAVVPTTPQPDVVVLIHGFLATAGVLRPLRESLERAGEFGVASFTHPPGIGVVEVAERVGELVKSLRAERVQLVGHSIGGLAARWFVQELGGDPRVVGTLSLASPFWGVGRARLLPGRLARELRPGSDLLETVRGGIGRGVPHFAVSGSHDAVVGPALPLGAEGELVAEGCGHNALLYDPVVLGRVVSRVRQGRGQAAGTAL